MTVQSQLSNGSSGWIDPSALLPRRTLDTADEPAPPCHTIFLIGADPPELLSLFEWLSAAGYYTEATSDAARGLAYVRKHRPEIVLAGLNLRNMADLEILDGIREASPETRVIVVSDQLDWSVHELAHRHRASALLSRAAGAQFVLGAVKRLLGQKG